jgi:hypothetical protein
MNSADGVFVVGSEMKRRIRKSWRKWEDNIKIHLNDQQNTDYPIFVYAAFRDIRFDLSAAKSGEWCDNEDAVRMPTHCCASGR